MSEIAVLDLGGSARVRGDSARMLGGGDCVFFVPL